MVDKYLRNTTGGIIHYRMKLFKNLLLPLLLHLFLAGHAQDISGEYEAIYDLKNAYISYHLDLQPDGRFSFKFYRKNYCEICTEENQYGRGKWVYSDKKLELLAEAEVDVTNDSILYLNGSKAHYISRSPRDKSDKVVKTRLKFYASPVSWVKSMELIKK